MLVSECLLNIKSLDRSERTFILLEGKRLEQGEPSKSTAVSKHRLQRGVEHSGGGKRSFLVLAV